MGRKWVCRKERRRAIIEAQHQADRAEAAEAKLEAIENILDLTDVASPRSVMVMAIRRILNEEG